MEEVWYIEIFRGVEGPFSKEELKKDARLTPDTYVWREGFEQWKKIKDVPELDDLFEDEVIIPLDTNEETEPEYLDDEIVLENQSEPPPYLYWLLFALLALSYLTYSYFFKSQG